MKFCSLCGHEVALGIPPGDNRPRYSCASCGTIHYQNPNMVLGTVPVWGDRVLLCKRAIEPRYGYWTLPAGFMENGETTVEGAARETVEEAGARVEIGELFSMLDVPHVHQVHIFFLAEMLGPELDPGPESLEAKLFDEAEIPWEQIAFRTVEQTLRWFFEDRRRGAFGIHTGAIQYPARRANR
ncbi:MAG: NUDIX hydrolase [Limnobacter sp.]|nr:NUDIX hydrolase [Limnobacter sp.]